MYLDRIDRNGNGLPLQVLSIYTLPHPIDAGISWVLIARRNKVILLKKTNAKKS